MIYESNLLIFNIFMIFALEIYAFNIIFDMMLYKRDLIYVREKYSVHK